ncbi:MAG: sugar phosphate isomerase/epimerase family protein [Armatimonadota bacterium]
MRVLLRVFALGLLIALAATAGTCQSLDHSALKKLGWKLGVQAFTFREMSLFETIDTLKSLDIRYVELFPGQRLSKERPVAVDHNMPAELIDELARKLKASRVQAVAYGVVGLGPDEANARKMFEFAKKLGIETITAEPSEQAMPMLDKLCQEYKINIAIHNHPRPSHYWSPDVILQATKGCSKRIGSCADVGHWYRSGLAPMDCLRQLKGRVVSLHLKDLNQDKGDVPIGTGVLDVKALLTELKRQGFKGVISIEYEVGTGQQLIDDVAKCARFVSGVATELAKAR